MHRHLTSLRLAASRVHNCFCAASPQAAPRGPSPGGRSALPVVAPGNLAAGPANRRSQAAVSCEAGPGRESWVTGGPARALLACACRGCRHGSWVAVPPIPSKPFLVQIASCGTASAAGTHPPLCPVPTDSSQACSRGQPAARPALRRVCVGPSPSACSAVV